MARTSNNENSRSGKGEEYVPPPYVDPVASNLIGSVLDGTKFTTYRFGSKYGYLNVGDRVGVQDSASKAIVAYAEIIGRRSTTFLELPLSVDGHEPYRDKEDQRLVLSGYYSYIGREIRDDDPFLVLEIRLLDVVAGG